MMSILSNGGPLTWIVLIWALALYAGIFHEILKHRGRYAAVLRGALVGMVALGCGATAAGFMQTGSVSIDQYPLVMSVAMIPTAVATILAAPAAVLVGIVGARGSRAS